MTNFLFIKSQRIKQLGFLILMFMFSLGTQAQTTVSGKVSDKDGPIPGVNVSIKGTKTGTVTDMDGVFTLKSVPTNGVLIFSFIGYNKKEIAVNKQSKINVILESEITTLNNVVVVGYGSMKRADLTGAVSSVSSESFKQSVSTTIDQVLQGRAAGVNIQQNSGAPGASSSIRIRGISSLNGSNEPIFVIDGVIIDGGTGSSFTNPLSSINPSDIVSMDVLKDASATAIYGSRAANGVIMITTKHGKKGELSLTFDSYVGWQEIPKNLDLLNLREYAVHKNTLAEFRHCNT